VSNVVVQVVLEPFTMPMKAARVKGRIGFDHLRQSLLEGEERVETCRAKETVSIH